jgi:5-methyltetrahydrofolate--homocysteine methyltransferase
MGIKEHLDLLAKAIIDGQHHAAETLTAELLKENVSPKQILDEGLMTGMGVVGTRFKEGRIFLPQVLVSARAMKTAMGYLEPLLEATSYKSSGKILLGTVKGDVHDIGKNLVGIMLRGAGYQVVDLGVGCSAEQLVQQHELHKPDIVGLSALLTTTMVYMKTVVDAFLTNGITTPIIVGGAPVTSRFADEIGAAAYARNATETVDLVRSMLNESGTIH